MLFATGGETVDPDTGEITPELIPALPSHYKCPQTGAVLPVENPSVWVYQEEDEARELVPFPATDSGSAAPDSGQNPQILLRARNLSSDFSDFISVAWKVLSRIRAVPSEFCSEFWKFCFRSMPWSRFQNSEDAPLGSKLNHSIDGYILL
jgi:hypothetical protein